MGRYLQLVMGPAGAGKSTYCAVMEKHFQACNRPVKFINLDPAADFFKYDVAVDVRHFISLDDVAEELEYGPNGGLIFCMEYLLDNLSWLKEQVESAGDSDDEYFIVDCPGQIELFTHIPVMKKIVKEIVSWDIKVCGVYLIDALFVDDSSKYISGALMALSTMLQLEIPHVSVISKCDLKASNNARDGALEEQTFLEHGELNQFFVPDPFRLRNLAATTQISTSQQFKNLHNAICGLLEDYTLVNFLPLNIFSEESVEYVLLQVDHALQYGEDVEPKNATYDKQSPEGDFVDTSL